MNEIDASSGADVLSDDQVTTAVTQNAQFGTSLWKDRFDAISIYYLRFREFTPGPEQFAQAIARWQDAVGGMTVDGILGPGTWGTMRPRGEPNDFTITNGTVRPNGRAQVAATFGDVTAAGWEAANIVSASAPVGFDFDITVAAGIAHSHTLRVHTLLKDEFEAIFQEIADASLWDTIQPVGGVFVPRPVTGGTAPSMHHFGIAMDINPAAFARGQATSIPDPGVIAIFQNHGFHWGVFFETPDPMHFQYVTGA